MSRKSKTAKRPVASAMTPEQVRWVQELRRSSASERQGKRPTRSAAKRQAINAAW